MRPRLGAKRRLRTPAQFDAVFKRGVRLAGRLFLLVALPNRSDQDRLGVAVSRRVGGAVERNRARRLLRESFRRLARPAREGLDVVIVGHRELSSCRQSEVDRELQDRYERLAGGAKPRRAPAAARS